MTRDSVTAASQVLINTSRGAYIMEENGTPQLGETSRIDGQMPPGNQPETAVENALGPKLVYSDGIPSSEEINPRGEPLPPIKMPSDDGDVDVSQFEATSTADIAGVKTLVTGLPVIRPGDVRDYFRLHPGDEWWKSKPFCLLTVPIIGIKNPVLHLIGEDLAQQYLDPADYFRRRLLLGSKPHNVFFIASMPCDNLDNSWNDTCMMGCEQAKTLWTKVSSEKAEGYERYKIKASEEKDAFPEPAWPNQTRSKLINAAFRGRMIMTADHPALLRKRGCKIPTG
jgi:hypothetical protein